MALKQDGLGLLACHVEYQKILNTDLCIEIREMEKQQAPFQVRIALERDKYSEYVKAIKPDLGTRVGRSRTWLEEDSESFYIYIQSPDTVALRAALGSISRWFKVVREVMEVVS